VDVEPAANEISGDVRLEVAATIEQASRFVPVERIYPCTNCGMAPMDRSLAISKLVALSAGAALARRRFDHSAGEEGCE
jgi:methionine synthase II (cobalamin-independent)